MNPEADVVEAQVPDETEMTPEEFDSGAWELADLEGH